MYYLRVINRILGSGLHTLQFKFLDSGSFGCKSFCFRVIPETKKILSLSGLGFQSYDNAYKFLRKIAPLVSCSIHFSKLDFSVVYERDVLDSPDLDCEVSDEKNL